MFDPSYSIVSGVRRSTPARDPDPVQHRTRLAWPKMPGGAGRPTACQNCRQRKVKARHIRYPGLSPISTLRHCGHPLTVSSATERSQAVRIASSPNDNASGTSPTAALSCQAAWAVRSLQLPTAHLSRAIPGRMDLHAREARVRRPDQAKPRTFPRSDHPESSGQSRHAMRFGSSFCPPTSTRFCLLR